VKMMLVTNTIKNFILFIYFLEISGKWGKNLYTLLPVCGTAWNTMLRTLITNLYFNAIAITLDTRSFLNILLCPAPC
jgi:hypothetical protein